jgi:hypothetical protein
MREANGAERIQPPGLVLPLTIAPTESPVKTRSSAAEADMSGQKQIDRERFG